MKSFGESSVGLGFDVRVVPRMLGAPHITELPAAVDLSYSAWPSIFRFAPLGEAEYPSRATFVPGPPRGSVHHGLGDRGSLWSTLEFDEMIGYAKSDRRLSEHWVVYFRAVATLDAERIWFVNPPPEYAADITDYASIGFDVVGYDGAGIVKSEIDSPEMKALSVADRTQLFESINVGCLFETLEMARRYRILIGGGERYIIEIFLVQSEVLPPY